MIKLLAMDVDNTLAKLNEPLLESTISIIKRINNNGTRIMMISGKPVAYLTGKARQVGIKDILLSGENGVTINEGIEFPPKKVYKLPISSKQKKNLREIKDILEKTLKEKIWFQPNEVQVTVFFFHNETKNKIIEIIRRIFSKNLISNELKYYIHSDCVDIVPEQISKGNAIEMYMRKNNIKSNEVITVGDGINDISMFRVSDESILIGASENIETTYVFKKIDSALLFVEEKGKVMENEKIRNQ